MQEKKTREQKKRKWRRVETNTKGELERNWVLIIKHKYTMSERLFKCLPPTLDPAPHITRHAINPLCNTLLHRKRLYEGRSFMSVTTEGTRSSVLQFC